MINWINSIFGESSDPLQQPVVPTTKKQSELYSRNPNGWETYSIEKLTEQQCQVVETACRGQASFQRKQAIIKILGGAIIAAGAVFAAIMIAKFAAGFFALCLAKSELITLTKTSEFSYFIVKVLSHAATYLGMGIAINKLWKTTYSTYKQHWDYAAHLDEQVVKTLLRKATFEKRIVEAPQPAPVVIQPSAPPVEEV